MSKHRFPTKCPACDSGLHVSRLVCATCGTKVEGNFPPPLLSRLDSDEKEFVVRMVLARGSLKELARMYGVSYPTVRNRLESLRERVCQLENEEQDQDNEKECES